MPRPRQSAQRQHRRRAPRESARRRRLRRRRRCGTLGGLIAVPAWQPARVSASRHGAWQGLRARPCLCSARTRRASSLIAQADAVRRRVGCSPAPAWGRRRCCHVDRHATTPAQGRASPGRVAPAPARGRRSQNSRRSPRLGPPARCHGAAAKPPAIRTCAACNEASPACAHEAGAFAAQPQ